MLRVKDLKRVTVCAKWLLELYPPEQTALQLGWGRDYDFYRTADGRRGMGREERGDVASLLTRRPGLTSLTVRDAKAIQALLPALASGTCPKLRELRTAPGGDPWADEEVRALGQALSARAASGGSGLTHLALSGTFAASVGGVLGAPGCEGLQELALKGRGERHGLAESVGAYLTATRAVELRRLTVDFSPTDQDCQMADGEALVTAFAPGVAPRVEALSLVCLALHGPGAQHLSGVMGRGAGRASKPSPSSMRGWRRRTWRPSCGAWCRAAAAGG